ncbi:LOW QUALITY PROTEIN: CMP-N-acetylneuraminate-beta-galactosamide-alpha-2,3-sialyltransferase 1-like [Cyclopterus lumpus]|uniref:LOW QUALITY PROTEIN: CMP-N-acetylneuraminate-beta-galactosamide-alpha-2, 3-sialyltransferase 1-like n=1 Tax=Cyclopterus lumpus TaxID=8103 RepID=UPI0014866F2E|nr:LOW QUALITY PROTEIN: CMP-N-acetylneuraminate-beta-galactosamide-alpha-2,3-sialyltransferase 1-like [Cyclopterus lumpus]
MQDIECYLDCQGGDASHTDDPHHLKDDCVFNSALVPSESHDRKCVHSVQFLRSNVSNICVPEGSHYGPLIDFQDFVIRMNRGSTKGFEADVGTRTTHHVIYPESAVNLENNTHLVYFPYKIRDFVWITKALNTSISYNKRRLIIKYVHEVWLKKKGYYPSTGFLTLILALHICDEVHVFGYGADSDGSWRHYWEELRNKKFKTGVHAGDVEYAKIKELAQNETIKFYRGG